VSTPMVNIALNKRDFLGEATHRIVPAAVSAVLMGGYSSQYPNVPAPTAVAFGVAGAIAVLSPMRSARIVAYIAAAFSGVLLAVFGLLSRTPPLLIMVLTGSASLVLCVAVWREATGSGAHWWHRLLAGLVSAAALLVLYQGLTHIGAEGVP
jgi:hypothetical protein